MRTIANKFPQYSFEDLLDKTPAWINWTLLQAVNLDIDLMNKFDMALGGIFGTGGARKPAGPAKPKTQAEHDADRIAQGFKIRRE